MNWGPVYNIHPLLVHKHIRDIENNKKRKISPINHNWNNIKSDNDILKKGTKNILKKDTNNRSFWSYFDWGKKD